VELTKKTYLIFEERGRVIMALPFYFLFKPQGFPVDKKKCEGGLVIERRFTALAFLLEGPVIISHRPLFY
jgi:hypothetical protein